MVSSENKIKVNLFDVLASHSVVSDGFYTFTPLVEPAEIEYHAMMPPDTMDQLNAVARNEGPAGADDAGAHSVAIQIASGPDPEYYLTPHAVSVYTDRTFGQPAFANRDTSGTKVAWILECHEVHPHNRINAIQTEDVYDYIFTFDEELLARGPKYIENLIGTSRIIDSRSKLYKKTKNISLIASKQNWCSGHQLRHKIVEECHSSVQIDLWGSAYKPFPMGAKVLPLAEYRFSIVVENSQGAKYFTEKIIDCFRTGTIPIYWGCPNIDKYFDIDGIICFETIEQLNSILPALNQEEYDRRFESVKKNFKLAKQWTSMDDTFARNLKRVVENHE